MMRSEGVATMNFPVELDDWIENQKASENQNVGRDMYGLQPFPPVPSVGRNATPRLRSRKEDETLSNSQGSLEALDVLCSRYRHVLSLVAYRVLGNHAEAEDAVQNCLLTVFGNVPKFENEGAFRCWLVRVLIDEAVTILARQNSSRGGSRW
jgi:RNA polymerase sigma-70 factor (ECF subfamily)